MKTNSNDSLLKSKLELKGKLIVVERIDGSGKSTQIRLVSKWLKSKLLPIIEIFTPTEQQKLQEPIQEEQQQQSR